MAPLNSLVVGGTSGIGRGIAVTLAKSGSSVTIAGRSASAGNEIVEEMKQAAPNADSSFKFEKVDCFDLSSVKALADRTLQAPLDCLVLTQGMATIQGHTPTKDGLDQKLQLHVYSRHLLAKLISPHLAANANGGQVMSVLSAGVHGSFANYSSDPKLEKSYSVKNAADAAGFYNDIFLEGLANEHAKVAFAHAAPGFVSTSWGTEMPAPLRMLIRPLQYALGKDKYKCGEDMMKNFFQCPQGKLTLVDQHGAVGKASLTAEHDEAKDKVYGHLNEVLSQWC
ncbi:hypothetical protein TeGR_g7288 [Tetraparma gracilis]|uniref:Uncharacterized protein n=1 Tax=Tetraparma gracilis TaxID=2962635 RepID=A0ABQ6MN63_9STRA|nr:hypothetical protein TeGR_g7288 [Tetraparma gracilis]